MEQDKLSAKEFVNFIKQKLDFQRWEAERKSKLFIVFSIQIFTLFLLVLAQFIIYIPCVFAFIYVIILMIALIYSIGAPVWENKSYKQEFKKICEEEVKAYFDLLGSSKNAFNEKLLQESHLFSSFKKVELDDCFAGFHNDVCFKVAEMSLIDYLDLGSERNRYEFTVFKGVVIMLESNKNIGADTIVASKHDFCILNKFNLGYLSMYALMPAILALGIILFDLKNWYANFFLVIFFLFISLISLITLFSIAYFINIFTIKDMGMKKVHLEDVNFARKFNVYSKDQVEARYLLTTSFIDRYKNLQTAFKVKNIRCSFFKNKIMFVLPTSKDCFELASIYKPVGADLETFYKQIKSIYDMIDYFKLNEKTGL